MLIAVTAVCCTVSVYTKLAFIALLSVLACVDFIGAMKKANLKGSALIPSVAVALAVLSLLISHDYLVIIAVVAVLAILIKAVIRVDAPGAIAELCALVYPCSLLLVVAIAATSKIWISVFLIACVSTWICDAFALFGGLLFGKHRLAPKVSPKKSIEGAVSGALFSVFFAIPVFFILKHFEESGIYCPSLAVCIICSLICSSLGQFGDLAASVFKRYVGIKDYSNLIPGHGGVLDRLDSLLFSIPVAYLMLGFIYNRL